MGLATEYIQENYSLNTKEKKNEKKANGHFGQRIKKKFSDVW